MKLRLPAYPLVTVDPFFNIWSASDCLNQSETVHWSGKINDITATITVADKKLCFIGCKKDSIPMEQVSVNVTALSTEYIFQYEGVRVTAVFTSPLLINDLKLLSTPVSYLKIKVNGADENSVVEIRVSERLCLNEAGQYPVEAKKADVKYPTVKMGSRTQNLLGAVGDMVCIDYGYLYLSSGKSTTNTFSEVYNGVNYIGCKIPVNTNGESLVTLAYDDVYAVEYFGERLKSLWNADGTDIATAIENAINHYDSIKRRCDDFDRMIYEDAVAAGGEYYAELLVAAYRQVMAGHKLAVDKNGELLWISKECSSNGCAATVDISYPSSPLFMIYNTKLLKAMLVPVFKYAQSDKWSFEFAPHDVGTYPVLNGQTYYENKREYQMPVEECGNMLLLSSALSLLEKNSDFIVEHSEILNRWADYLLECGFDPENQLCTDDFAGNLAHNCNLSLKTICSLAAYSRAIAEIDGARSEKIRKAAEEMAQKWVTCAANGDGSFRLAFDQPDTYSMKYNLVWNKIMHLGLFEEEIVQGEVQSYFGRMNQYGMPLDNRKTYTKSDWYLWCATLFDNDDDFNKFIKPLWDSYHETPSRVPLSDWYYTDTAEYQMFKNRTVQGGLWIKLLDAKGIF